MNDFSNFVPLTAQGVVVMYLLNDFFCLCIFKGGLLAVSGGHVQRRVSSFVCDVNGWARVSMRRCEVRVRTMCEV